MQSRRRRHSATRSTVLMQAGACAFAHRTLPCTTARAARRCPRCPRTGFCPRLCRWRCLRRPPPSTAQQALHSRWRQIGTGCLAGPTLNMHLCMHAMRREHARRPHMCICMPCVAARAILPLASARQLLPIWETSVPSPSYPCILLRVPPVLPILLRVLPVLPIPLRVLLV